MFYIDMASNLQMPVWQKRNTFLCKFVFVVNDLTSIILLLRYEELVKNYPVEYIAGGDCQNSMRAAQWMLNDFAPGAVRYIGNQRNF